MSDADEVGLCQPVTNKAGEADGLYQVDTNADDEPVSDASGVPEWMPLADAAVQLAISLPRLRRLLTRPDLAPLVETRTRQTRTGTRTAQGVNRSELFRLRESLDTSPSVDDEVGEPNENSNENEPEREREQGSEPFKSSEPFPVVDNPTSEVVYLRARLADALQLLAREQQAHAETRQIAARLMLSVEESKNGFEDLANGSDGSNGNENGNENGNAGRTVPVNASNGAQEAAGGDLSGGVESKKQTVKLSWWARFFRGGG